MSRRSSPQRDIDDQAFPIRIKIVVPPDGLGRELDRIGTWLKANVALGDHAHHTASALGGSATGYYFRRIGDAAAFLAAFPHLELTDGTTSRAYRSPLFPFGRQPS